MHPVVRECGVERRFRLRALILVVREAQIRAAAMDVEGQMEILLGHGRAFDMPTGTAFAPRRRPARLAWLRRLPEREIERIALAIFQALAIGAQFTVARFHLVHIAVREFAIRRIGTHGEVHIAINLIRMAFVDQALHELDHRVDLFGSLRANIGVLHAGCMHIGDEGIGVFFSDLGSRSAFLERLVDDLVVHVGHILHKGNFEPAPREVATDGVERDERARIADMDVVVHGRAAHVHAYFALVHGNELALGARFSVVDLDHGVPILMVSVVLVVMIGFNGTHRQLR